MRDPSRPSADPEDDSLMRLVAAGDHDALGVLFSRHHVWVHALCYRLVGDPDAAEDLVQECFLRVQRYGRTFQGGSRFTTWLYRVVRNTCMDHITSNERDQRRQRDAAEHLHRESAPPVEFDDRLELVRRALYRISPDKREVLVLSRYQGLRYAEIAELLGITVDAVKARAHRAIRDLRRIFHELEQQA